MSFAHRSRSTGIDWLAEGPLGLCVDTFKGHLTERRCTARTFASYSVGTTYFARWARSRRLSLNPIDKHYLAHTISADAITMCSFAGLDCAERSLP